MAEKPKKWWLPAGVLVGALVACGGDGGTIDDVASGPCMEVSSELEADLTVERAMAVEAGKGLGNSERAWYVSAENGATWVTNIDPSLEEDLAGLIAALNGTARTTSEVGSEVGLNPGGFSDDDAGAVKSRSCVSG
jgi:hypothetical protein